MADLDEKPAGSETPAPEIPTVPTRRPQRKRSLKLDHEAIVSYVLTGLDQDLEARTERMKRREARYAKHNGWLPDKDWPYADCSNWWDPTMATATMRMAASLENAAKSQRPTLMAKAIQRRNAIKTDRVDKLLDFQFHVENEGDKFIDSYVFNFLHDEAVFTFVPWCKETQTISDVRVLDGLAPEVDHIAQIITRFPIMFPSFKENEDNATMKDNAGWKWEVYFTDDNNEAKVAAVEFWDRDDGKLEARIKWRATVEDKPTPQVLDFEDVVFPPRSGNCQPPSGANPYGAPYVNRICKASLDTIRRRMKDKTYDLLEEKDWTAIKAGKSAIGSGAPEEEPKVQKDEQEGVEATFWKDKYDDRQIIEHYGRWDVDGDGIEEDVIFWVIRDSRKLAKACLLTDMYPGAPIRRPINSQSIFPIPNRIWGRSFDEWLEPIQDQIQTALNQLFDFGTLKNMPWGFYDPLSNMKQERIRLEPGILNPLSNPQKNVYFPNMQQGGEAFHINTITLLRQNAERLPGIPDTAYGRIPAGKASALRNTGTVMSLMGQTDVRVEQILRRLFNGLGHVFQSMHRLNKRYMPEKKEVRMVGIAEAGQDAYTDIQRTEIDMEVDFEFKATMLNSNKEAVAGALDNLAAKIFSPIAIQMGITKPEHVYNLIHDSTKALDLDPDRYSQRPAQRVAGPKSLAEEVLTAIMDHQKPEGGPLEPAEEHLNKLMQYQTGPEFQMFDKVQKAYFNAWLHNIAGIIQAEQQEKMMLAAASQSVKGLQGGGGGQGGAGGEALQNPAVQPGELVDESIGNVQ